MIKVYVDLTTYTRQAKFIVISDNCEIPTNTILSGRTVFEIMKVATTVGADEIVLLGNEEYARNIKKDLDNFSKIDYNNTMDKQIKISLGGN